MSHDGYQEQISQLLDGELSRDLQPALFVHLSRCTECQQFLNATIVLRSTLTASTISVPQSLDQWVLSSLPGSLIYQLNARPAAFRLAIAASVAFILLMGSLLFGPQFLTMEQTPQAHQLPTQQYYAR
jgi:anti-sigma factor RsiW